MHTCCHLQATPSRLDFYAPQHNAIPRNYMLSQFRLSVCQSVRRHTGGSVNKKAVLSQRWPRNSPYIWVPWKFLGTPWLRPRLLFPKILWAFVPMVPFERSLVNFYRPSIVTFPLSLRVSEILPLFFSSMPLFPYPTFSLPKISPCSPRSRWIAFWLQKRRCWAIVRAISFQDYVLCSCIFTARRREVSVTLGLFANRRSTSSRHASRVLVSHGNIISRVFHALSACGGVLMPHRTNTTSPPICSCTRTDWRRHRAPTHVYVLTRLYRLKTLQLSAVNVKLRDTACYCSKSHATARSNQAELDLRAKARTRARP